MSASTAPVTIKSLPVVADDILTMLFEIRQELRILNTIVTDGLNSRIDPEELRKDPYYSGSADDAGTTTR